MPFKGKFFKIRAEGILFLYLLEEKILVFPDKKIKPFGRVFIHLDRGKNFFKKGIAKKNFSSGIYAANGIWEKIETRKKMRESEVWKAVGIHISIISFLSPVKKRKNKKQK